MPKERWARGRGVQVASARFGGAVVNIDTARLVGSLAEVAAAGQPAALAEPVTG